jgi:hypothetical protein
MNYPAWDVPGVPHEDPSRAASRAAADGVGLPGQSGATPGGASPDGVGSVGQSTNSAGMPRFPAANVAAQTRKFATAAQALAAVRAGLEYLAGLDAFGLTGAEQADCLRGLAAAESVHLAAAARMLGAFDRAAGYTADGQGGPKAWLVWQARITRPAAGAAMAWTRRLAAHPAVAAALAAARLSPSYARRICDWTESLPEQARPGADEILTAAAAAGLELADLAVLFEEIRARTARPDADGEQDRFGQRRLFLDRHWRGHASLIGELTPQAAAALDAVLDSLGKPAGPEDLRTKAQRDHDALEEACRRLIAAGCLPETAGQPVHIELQMTLSQLLGHAAGTDPGDPALEAGIAANGTPVPPGGACDAAFTPIVTGTIDHQLLDQLAARWLTSLDGGLGGRGGGSQCRCGDGNEVGSDGGSSSGSQCSCGFGDGNGIGNDAGSTESQCGCEDRNGRALRAARQLIVAEAVRLLSGPGGLAAQLRTGVLAGPGATISLPLDIGRMSNLVPPYLRRAIGRRDRHCRFPGCNRPVRGCQVHHLIPWSEGGETSLDNCCLLCPFHHLIVLHRWGWHLTLNPDGTTTARSPDGKRILHSHAPPVRAA